MRARDGKFDRPKRRRQGRFADEDYNDRNRCEKNVFGVDGHYFIRAYEIVSPPAPEIVRKPDPGLHWTALAAVVSVHITMLSAPVKHGSLTEARPALSVA